MGKIKYLNSLCAIIYDDNGEAIGQALLVPNKHYWVTVPEFYPPYRDKILRALDNYNHKF